MRNPERHHNKNHRDRGEPFESCWACSRDRAVCRSKIRFAGWEEANAWIKDKNESEGFSRPTARYRCRWCDGWHMKTAKDVRARARVEKQRRKWLANNAEAS